MKTEKINILIVDDDESVRYMLETKFMTAGYSVTTAGNGSHAIQILQSGKTFNLMVCDLKMQMKNGLELIQYLKSINSQMPVIILTGFPDREKIVAAATMGVRDVMVKPVKHQDLLTMVKNKLGATSGEKTAA